VTRQRVKLQSATNKIPSGKHKEGLDKQSTPPLLVLVHLSCNRER
jgi:hypothetical protein